MKAEMVSPYEGAGMVSYLSKLSADKNKNGELLLKHFFVEDSKNLSDLPKLVDVE